MKKYKIKQCVMNEFKTLIKQKTFIAFRQRVSQKTFAFIDNVTLS